MTLFGAYRFLAYVVGVMLAFNTVTFIFKYGLSDGSSLQRFGEDMTFLWTVHGWVFMIYVVVAFLLARRQGWSLQFTGLVLVAGLVPLLIFWVERRVAERYRAEHLVAAD